MATALSLIDRDGLDAFSMRGLADALGVYPTAVYWYVANRNALLAGVVAHALSGVMPSGDAGEWRSWLKELFRRYRDAVRVHPNIAPLIGAQLVSNGGIGPELIDKILSVLFAAGFEDEQLVHAFNTVIATKVGFVTLEFSPMPSEHIDTWAAEIRNKFRLADPKVFPTLARNLPLLENRAFIVRWQNGTEVPLDGSFEMFIDVAVNGLEQVLLSSAKP